jgi:hypothetical protein
VIESSSATIAAVARRGGIAWWEGEWAVTGVSLPR